MTAYAIGQLTIHNTDWMQEYTDKIGAVIQKHGGRVVAKGQPHQLEGQADVPNVLISIEFPDSQAAKAWYQDPSNQQLVNLRQSGSSFELLLVDGM